MRYWRTLVGLVVVFGLMGVALPAAAIPPEIERIELSVEDFIPDACGPGAHLAGPVEVTISDMFFFDGDGNLTKVKTHILGDGVYTRTDTGKSFRDKVRLTIVFDVATGAETITGLDFNWVYPGLGAVFQSIGRTVSTPDEGLVFTAGPNDFLEGLDPFEEICEALA